MSLLSVLTLAAATTAAPAAPPANAALTPAEKAAARAIRANGLRADVRFLAHDLLEGRGPGSRGDQLAEAYIATRLEGLGLEPGAPDGSWFQPLELVSVTTHAPQVAPRAARSRERRVRAPRGLRGGVRRADPAGQGRERRGRLRRLRHRGPRVPVGRLQGRRPQGQGPADDEQRPRGRPEALRGQDAALLRPLGLQVRDGGQGWARRRRSSSTPRPRPATRGRWCRPPSAGRASPCPRRDEPQVQVRPG